MTPHSSPLHIGLVGPLPPPFGGMANQTRQLKTLLESEGLQVTLVQTNAPYAYEWMGKLSGLRALFRLVPYIRQLWRAAGTADLMHVMANSGWSWQLFAAPAIWIGYFRKCPVIVNYRGGEAREYLAASSQWVKPTLAKAAALVVPSGFLKAVFAEFGVAAAIIPNIVDLKRFSPRAVPEITDPRAPHLVITRNLEAIYGLKTAVQAIAILQKSIPGIRVSIAGSGPQREELQQLIESLQLQQNVVLTGRLPPEEVARLYAAADLMLNPTTVDNMPNSVLEALGCGLPVVTTNVGGIPYVVTDRQTALLVEPNQPEMMAAAIMELLEDKALYQKLSRNGLAEAQQYTWEHIKTQWLDLYQRVIAI